MEKSFVRNIDKMLFSTPRVERLQLERQPNTHEVET